MPQKSTAVLIAVALSCALGAHLSGQGALTANAGPDQSGMFVGTTVNLTGAGSVGATSYTWSFVSRPSGSTAALVNPSLVTPTFVPDKRGAYTVRLVVGNGSTTASDTVVITTGNRPPVAAAGPDETATVGKKVALSGLGSSDPDLDKITYQWTVVSGPPTSLLALTKANTSKPSIILDRPGAYVIALVVNDGLLSSSSDEITITTTNTPPVARAGADRQVPTGIAVQLDGGGSSDVDEDPLTYSWKLKKPQGSSAALAGASSPLPTFTPDLAGTYTVTLTVNDGTKTAKDAVAITTNANVVPIARGGRDETTLQGGQTIQLDGSRSTDANGQLQSYLWTLTKKPGASSATISGPNTPRPTFTADKNGSYTFTLGVTDPGALTATDTRVYKAALPVADAGGDQVVTLGGTVTLDGSASSHLDGALGYGWALLSMPAGSTAQLDDPSDPQPSFVADLEGTYVAQLIVFDGATLSEADTVVISTNTNLPPHVVRGADRLVTMGTPTIVNAVATDPNLDALTFSWALVSRPAGSSAALSSSSGPSVQITADAAGDYIVQLVATDPGGLSSVDTLLLTTGNTAPTAEAGEDRNVATGTEVGLELVGGDPDNGALSYAWSILKKPAGSDAEIDNPSAQTPSFAPDADGVYVVQVIVRDAMRLFASDATVIRATAGGNAPPVADAGDPQTILPGNQAQLDGTGSSDPENQPLTYAWAIVSKPVGSAAALSNPTASQPTVQIDLSGAYVVELVVNDGTQDSAPDQVTITGNAPPSANAGNDQVVDVNTLVQLSGTGSFDPESQPLTYQWSFTSKPAGSTATLSSTTSATPTFTPDLIGVYVVQLVVNDGAFDSAADTVSISTPRALTIAPSAVTLSPGGSQTLTVSVTFSSSSNLVLQLSSSNTNVATVPASVTILANQVSATFNVTAGTTNGGAIITAKGTGVGSASANVALGARLVEWNVDASGAWETPGNWTGNAIPGPGDVVVIDRPAGNFAITIGVPTAAVASLYTREYLNVFSTLTVDGAAALDGGANLTATFAGAGKATLGAPTIWTSGTIALAGGLEVLSAQTLTFPSNGAGRFLQTSSLLNHGTVVMGQSNSLTLMGSSPTLTNAADGVWTASDTTVSVNGGSGHTFTNAGILRKTAASGGGLTFAALAVSNTGTIEILNGHFQVHSGATLTTSGLLSLAATTTFYLDAVTLAAGSTFSGAGLLLMNGTTTVTGNLTLTVPSALHATLTGPGAIHLAAPMSWVGGTISLAGGLEVLSAQTLTFPANGAGRFLQTSSLLNHGTVVMGQSNSLTLMGSSPTLTNAADGVWTASDTAFSVNGGSGHTFTNAGILRKTAASGGGLTFAALAVSNTGTIEILNGHFQVHSGATLTTSGLLSLAATTTFYLDAVTLAAGSTFSGAGLLLMNGTTTVTANLTLTVPSALHATLTGPGAIHLAAPMSWVGGTISLAGGLEVLSAQTLTFPANGAGRFLQTSSLLNHGTVVMGQSNSLTLMGTSPTLTNAADGVWTASDTTVSVNGGSGHTFTNAGILRKTAASGGGLTFAALAVSNTGTIEILNGHFQVHSGATLTTSGLLSLAATTTFYLDAVTLAAGSTFSGAGLLLMNGTTTVTGNLTLTVPSALHATLTGPGAIHLAAPMSWVGGTISLAGGLEVLSAQTLTFPANGAGRFLQTSSLLNHGTVVMGQSNSLTLMGSSPTLTNAADGVWTASDTAFSVNGGSGHTFTNAGILRKTAASGGGLTFAALAVSNTGTIEILNGHFQVHSGATLTTSGLLSLAATTTFYLDAVTLAAGSTFSGAGLLSMNGTTTVTGNLTLTVPSALHATLTGPGAIHLAAPMSWVGGTISLAGGLEVLSAQTLTFPANGASRFLVSSTGTSLRNHGIVAWQGATTLVYQGGNIAVTNESDGSWTFGAGSHALSSNGAPSPAASFTFVNNGSMQGPGAGTTLSVASTVSFANSGSINGITVLP